MWTYNAPPEVDAQSEYPTIIGVSLSLTILMTALVALRAYVRIAIVKSPGNDDYVTFGAAIVSIVYNIMAIYQTRLGLGLPVALRPKPDLAEYSVINFAGRPLYMLGVTGYKVALCFAYLRFVSRGMHIFRKLTWSLMGFIIVSHLACTLVIIFQCHPVAKSWKPKLPGWCLANYPTWNATASVTIVCDVITFLLPVPVFARLKIDIRRKLGLIFLFALGLFTTVCSIMRMVQIRQIAKDGNNSTLVLWGTAELNVGIILTCLPAVAPLFKSFYRNSRKGSLGYTPQSLDKNSRGAVRLQTMSKSSTPGEIARPKKAHMDDQESEESILPMHGAELESDLPPWITKTTDVYVTSNERTASAFEPNKPFG